MDFVDEKCIIFDSEEENKFIYSDIHRDFRDHVEALISSNLGELDISIDKFYESCVKGRQGRDINQAVFERLIAMDDFTTFKRLMVKRNMELQLEALRTFNATPYKAKEYYSQDRDEEKQFEAALRASVASDITSPLPHPDDMRSVLDRSTNDTSMEMTEEEMQNILHQSLMEMELLHRQEELEQAELERAVALSLAIEAERLQILASEAKASDFIESKSSSSEEKKTSHIRESYEMSAKDINALSQPRDGIVTSPNISDSNHYSISDSNQYNNNNNDNNNNNNNNSYVDVGSKEYAESSNETIDGRSRRSESKRISLLNPVNALPAGNFADPKPLKFRNNLQGSKPLPSIIGNNNSGGGITSLSSLSTLANELEDKKKLANEAVKRGQEQLAIQRQQEEELRKQLNIDPNEVDERAQRMREQRDRLIAMKKAERQRKVQAEEEAVAKVEAANIDMIDEAVAMDEDSKATGGLSESEIEQRRSNIRKALAYRMKMELISDADSKAQKRQEQSLQNVEKTIKQVERLRVENRQREELLEKKNKRIVQNMKAGLSVEDSEF